jgi:hypothetical protein
VQRIAGQIDRERKPIIVEVRFEPHRRIVEIDR